MNFGIGNSLFDLTWHLRRPKNLNSNIKSTSPVYPKRSGQAANDWYYKPHSLIRLSGEYLFVGNWLYFIKL
ncbi:hypothetical protein [Cyclobacterium plantarum]|uniref:Uncharacterized protein n=1 Tax=Cyclobacterium plantarum TaxID=2716263 RepID=A0ABX0HF42_9BACT|nr:hypothetical protein [Cyclobacterium plantarum]NHE58640.1 hypothetical protein [Cyclobacterium plantarum]